MTGTAGAPGGHDWVTAAGPLPALRDSAERWPVMGEPRYARGSLVALRTDHVRMPDGQVAARDVVEHPGAVAVVALDLAGRVLLVRQYRHPVGRLLWEIPAGLRDVEGEQPLATAERELLEESGYTARQWHVLTDFFPSPGITSERIRVFLARDVARAPASARRHEARHEEAHLVPAWVPLPEAARLVLAGALHNGVAAVGILAAYTAQTGGFGALREAGSRED